MAPRRECDELARATSMFVTTISKFWFSYYIHLPSHLKKSHMQWILTNQSWPPRRRRRRRSKSHHLHLLPLQVCVFLLYEQPKMENTMPLKMILLGGQFQGAWCGRSWAGALLGSGSFRGSWYPSICFCFQISHAIMCQSCLSIMSLCHVIGMLILLFNEWKADFPWLRHPSELRAQTRGKLRLRSWRFLDWRTSVVPYKESSSGFIEFQKPTHLKFLKRFVNFWEIFF